MDVKDIVAVAGLAATLGAGLVTVAWRVATAITRMATALEGVKERVGKFEGALERLARIEERVGSHKNGEG